MPTTQFKTSGPTERCSFELSFTFNKSNKSMVLVLLKHLLKTSNIITK